MINNSNRKYIMGIGSGIAIAGIWIFAGMMATSKLISAGGVWFAIILAVAMTLIIK